MTTVRQRILQPGFFTDSKALSLSPVERLFFAGIWCAADREGRLEDKPWDLKSRLMPVDDFDPHEALNSMAKLGLIRRYQGQPKANLGMPLRIIVVTNFARHQRPHPREASSVLPAPPDISVDEAEMFNSFQYMERPAKGKPWTAKGMQLQSEPSEPSEPSKRKTTRTSANSRGARADGSKEKKTPHPKWNAIVDWLEAISVWAGCARPNWSSRDERGSLRSIINHVERNDFRLGLIGELWCLAQTNTEKFTPQALTLRAFEANFEKLRCWTGYQAALERQKNYGMPKEPDGLETPNPPNSAPPPLPGGQRGHENQENAPEGQPEAFKAILRAVQ